MKRLVMLLVLPFFTVGCCHVFDKCNVSTDAPKMSKKEESKKADLSKIGKVTQSEEGMVLTLKGEILFDPSKAELKPAAVTEINRVAEVLKKDPKQKVKVVGHTDDKGNAARNLSLSELRAQEVARQLAVKGFPEANITTAGKGESQPVGDNATEEGRMQNRRVEFILIK